MKCPSCQSENSKGARSCNGCGYPMPVACPKCGNVTPPGSRFCNGCGSPLEGKIAIERPKSVIEAERKQITVLFSDLSGYTAMTEKLDPEEVKEIKGRVFGEIAQVVARYEGYIYQLIGDQAMVLFGVPRVHEDDPFRAIRGRPRDPRSRGRPCLRNSKAGSEGPWPCIPASIPAGGHRELDLEQGLYGEITGIRSISLPPLRSGESGEILVGPETFRRTQGASRSRL